MPTMMIIWTSFIRHTVRPNAAIFSVKAMVKLIGFTTLRCCTTVQKVPDNALSILSQRTKKRRVFAFCPDCNS